jgi:cysteine-rich repeat protein
LKTFPYLILEICGDGILVGTELCDDFNSNDFDGCTNCTIDFGWTCDEMSFNFNSSCHRMNFSLVILFY